MTFLLPRAPTSGPRMRLYCETLPSLLVGVPSKNHKGRRRIPVLPPSTGCIAEVIRGLNAGSRYLSKRSVGSMMCMSQSTNRKPSFMSCSFRSELPATRTVAESTLSGRIYLRPLSSYDVHDEAH